MHGGSRLAGARGADQLVQGCVREWATRRAPPEGPPVGAEPAWSVGSWQAAQACRSAPRTPSPLPAPPPRASLGSAGPSRMAKLPRGPGQGPADAVGSRPLRREEGRAPHGAHGPARSPGLAVRRLMLFLLLELPGQRRELCGGCSVATSKRTAGCGPRASLPDEHRGWLPAGLCSGCCRSPVWGRATARPRGRCLGLGPPRGPVVTERAQSLLGATRSPTEPRPRRGRGAQLQPGPLGGLPAQLCPEAALWPAGWALAGLSAAPMQSCPHT